MVVLVSSVGWHNPVDAFARSRWVRAVATGTGAATATLCMTATTPDAVEAERAELPARVAALHAAGASVVAIDLDLSVPHPSDDDLRAAATLGPTVFGHAPGRTPFSSAHRSGVSEMVRTPLFSLAMGAPRPAPGPAPLALEALALHEGAPPPSADGDAWRVGTRRVVADRAAVSFLPYLIPFLHWNDPTTWGVVSGRVVVVGAVGPTASSPATGASPDPWRTASCSNRRWSDSIPTSPRGCSTRRWAC